MSHGAGTMQDAGATALGPGTLESQVAFRREETAGHIERMSSYCRALAERLGVEPPRCELIRRASRLHDIGKLAVPVELLLKPGRLTPEERGIVQRHAELGWRILSTSSSSQLLRLGATIALTHHERFDGSGYPRRLRGAEIPFEGRLAAVADVLDALTSPRVYRPAYPLEQALEWMRSQRGVHFDPDVLDCMLACADRLTAGA